MKILVPGLVLAMSGALVAADDPSVELRVAALESDVTEVKASISMMQGDLKKMMAYFDSHQADPPPKHHPPKKHHPHKKCCPPPSPPPTPPTTCAPKTTCAPPRPRPCPPPMPMTTCSTTYYVPMTTCSPRRIIWCR